MSVGPPAYLTVPSFEACLDHFQASETHRELCIPTERPGDCPSDSWNSLKELFIGIGCPKSNFRLIGGAAALPPVYLSVEGHKECLGEYQASYTHTEYCLPLHAPPRCSQDKWDKLSSTFQGVKCPPIMQVQRQGPLPSYPAHLTVPGK